MRCALPKNAISVVRNFSLRTSKRVVRASSHANAAAMDSAPRFRFGLLADIQYCDGDDRKNITGTQMRRYVARFPRHFTWR